MSLDCLEVIPASDDGFVGVRILQEKILFYYPEAYRLSSMDNAEGLRRDILTILSSVGLAKSIASPEFTFMSSFAENRSAPLVAFLWMLNDYCQNGLWVNYKKIYRNSLPGRINWKRTFQQTPLVSNGEFIYPHPVGEMKTATDDTLTEIHRLCVKTSIDFIGWIYNVRCDFEIQPINTEICRFYAYTLRKKLASTFQDSARERLAYMLQIIEGIDPAQTRSEIIYGVSSYHYIFERMVDAVFGNQTDLSLFFPKAYWVIDGAELAASTLHPDTVRIDGEKAYIIDSKYYGFGKRPDTSSIQKQITYAESLNVRSEGHYRIANAFILPYNKADQASPWKYLGYARTDWFVAQSSHAVIYAYYIDVTDLLRQWSIGWDSVVLEVLSDLDGRIARRQSAAAQST